MDKSQSGTFDYFSIFVKFWVCMWSYIVLYCIISL